MSEFISLFNGSEGNPTLPTPTIVMIGLMADAEKARPIYFQERGDRVLLLGTTNNELGCSEYGYFCHRQLNHMVPDINFELEKVTCELVVSLVEKELVRSVHDLSAGGLAVSLAECCLTSDRPVGATLKVENTLDAKGFRRDAFLFSESAGRFLISCPPEHEASVRELCATAGVPITAEGEVGGKEIRFEGAVEVDIPLSTAYKIWTRRLNNLLGLAHH